LCLVHVRIWDPLPRGSGRFYAETSEEATAVLEKALVQVWEREREASGVVVDAERSLTAAAIVAEASAWGADVIVMAQRPRRALSLRLWSKVCRRVVRQAPCPVLLAYEAGA